MKRSLYKRLHRTLRPYLGRADAARVATAVMVVPDSEVPRWSPGPGWMEMATACMWAKPTAVGLLVAVRTYGRDADGYATNDVVLATGVVRDLYGSLADKRHRIYQYAEPGTLRTEPIEPDHPAERYRAYWLEFAARFEQTVEQAQDEVDFPPRERTLDLRPEVSLRPDGRSWVCSVDVSLSPKRSNYWWDLVCCTEVLLSTARAYGISRIALYRANPHSVTDPLWHQGWDEVNLAG